jgi:hypothetical protein
VLRTIQQIIHIITLPNNKDRNCSRNLRGRHLAKAARSRSARFNRVTSRSRAGSASRRKVFLAFTDRRDGLLCGLAAPRREFLLSRSHNSGTGTGGCVFRQLQTRRGWELWARHRGAIIFYAWHADVHPRQ